MSAAAWLVSGGAGVAHVYRDVSPANGPRVSRCSLLRRHEGELLPAPEHAPRCLRCASHVGERASVWTGPKGPTRRGPRPSRATEAAVRHVMAAAARGDLEAVSSLLVRLVGAVRHDAIGEARAACRDVMGECERSGGAGYLDEAIRAATVGVASACEGRIAALHREPVTAPPYLLGGGLARRASA